MKRAARRVSRLGLDPDRLVFLDETWAKTNMARPRGRAARGEQVAGKVPHGHWRTTTFVAALRTTGMTAPTVVDGAINGRVFPAYVRRQLAPTLRQGDVVVTDNLSAHKVADVREAVEAAGARVSYLPLYSPDLNPIEPAFAKLKWLARSAAERTVEGLWQRLGLASDAFTPDECRNSLRHCGYATPA